MPLEFQKLWDNHPSNQNPADNTPCRKKDGTSAFENQCAIRLSVALDGAGMNMKACTKAKCWYGHGLHVLRAQELADWLALTQQLGNPNKFKGSDSLTGINGKKGIVFCQDFWGPGNTGDHIDLWDGTNMAHGSGSYCTSSTNVWFWEIKV